MKTPSAWLALVLFSASISAPLFAQDDGIGAGPRGGSVFAEFSAARPGQGEGVVWGGNGGGYIQGHILGFVARATALPSNAGIRMYNAVIGPRIAVRLPIVRPEAGRDIPTTTMPSASPARRGERRGRRTPECRTAFCREWTGAFLRWRTAIFTWGRAFPRSWQVRG